MRFSGAVFFYLKAPHDVHILPILMFVHAKNRMI